MNEFRGLIDKLSDIVMREEVLDERLFKGFDPDRYDREYGKRVCRYCTCDGDDESCYLGSARDDVVHENSMMLML